MPRGTLKKLAGSTGRDQEEGTQRFLTRAKKRCGGQRNLTKRIIDAFSRRKEITSRTAPSRVRRRWSTEVDVFFNDTG